VSFLILDSSATLAWIYGDEITEPSRRNGDARSATSFQLCRTHHRDNRRFGDEAAWWPKPLISSRLRGSWLSTRRIERLPN
jgi:hypothetical protein